MEKQKLRRLKYLQQNAEYLSRREQQELAVLEEQLRSEAMTETEDKYKAEQQALQDQERFERERAENARIAAAQDRQGQSPVSPLTADEDGARSANSKKNKRPFSFKRFLKRLALVLALLLAATLVLAVFALSAAEKTLKKTHVATSNPSAVSFGQPLSILLMGVDTGDASRGGSGSWNGNSDSQIIMTLNPQTNTTTMVSMERDTMTNILDQNGNQVSQQKMNAAYPAGYNAGGMSLAAEYAMQTIGTQAGIPVNHFVIINMDGLVNLVNDLGGIDVVNDSGATIMISNTEPEYTATVPYIPGNPPQHINGEQALVFARDRDTLPNGDYGRAAHQREVLTQIFKKLISLNTVFNYQKILNDISGDFKTNISFDNGTMFSLLSYKNCFNKMVSVQYQGVGEDAAGSDGIYASYQFMPANVDLAVQNLLRKSIGQSTISSLGSNMTTYEGWYGVNPPPYYMPSATVTTKGQTPVIYGVNPDGSYATITSSNSGIYVGANGAAVSGSQ